MIERQEKEITKIPVALACEYERMEVEGLSVRLVLLREMKEHLLFLVVHHKKGFFFCCCG